MAECDTETEPPIVEAAQRYLFFEEDGSVAPPWELIEARLCAIFHCRPSELEGEDADRLLLYYVLLQLDEMKHGGKKCPMM